MALPDRKARSPDRKALAKAIEDLLLASGAELDAETRETPARVAKAFSEDLLDGYERDPIETLKSSLVPAPRRGALVAGASRGIGRAVAEALIAEGIQVAVCALRAAPEVPGAAFAKRCDVSDEVEVRALFAEAGRCDCVVLNAGVLERAPIEDFTAAQWDRVLGVNLRGAFLCAREAFRTGATRIVGIGSVSGTLGTAHAAAYNASKWGLTGLVKSLAEEGRGRGIFCAAVLPGAVDTEMLKQTPFPPRMRPQEVARVVKFLCTDAPF